MAARVDVGHFEVGAFGDADSAAVHDGQQRAVTKNAWRFQQGFHFFATQHHRQFSFAPRKRDALDGDLPAERVGIEEAQRANHLDVGRQRHLFLFPEEKLALANVFRTKLVGWFGKC